VAPEHVVARRATRTAAAPNLGVLFDCSHFWSGLGKLEDLDTLRHGEVTHVHFYGDEEARRAVIA